MKFLEKNNIGGDVTGIDGVYIWVGVCPSNHGPRVKVSNLYNKFSKDNFVIKLPSLEVIGDVKINIKDFKKVIKFIENNLELLIKINNSEIGYIEVKDNFVKYFIVE